MSGIIPFLPFHVWLIALSMMSSRFIHMVAATSISSFFMTRCMYMLGLFLPFGCFLTVVNSAALNLNVHVFV